ncbi:uncharacterized mitochondrial protein AtMg00810-like [Malus domestica]|uniref:uncharacterized mitochondrial protein AtMg00810-like n=1 Tax=Malus domestica TaxID=3750 RepID=UPI0039758C35
MHNDQSCHSCCFSPSLPRLEWFLKIITAIFSSFGWSWDYPGPLIDPPLTVRVILSIVVNQSGPLYQMDVNNAFLLGELEEEVYMKLPPGHPQSLTYDNIEEVHFLKLALRSKFALKDLGNLKYFLDIELATSQNDLFLNQWKYTLNLLKKSDLKDCKPEHTPLDSKLQLNDHGEAFSNVTEYQRLRILRYLKETVGRGLLMQKNDNIAIIGYIYVDWVGNSLDHKLTTAFCTFVGGNLVTLRSKKQSVVARSSTEAEYQAMASIACELIWLKSILFDLGFPNNEPMSMFCDNQAAMYIASNPIFHE